MIGREIHRETEAKRQAMIDMTGVSISGCPWRSFRTPIVAEVLSAMRFEENGNLAVYLPSPSHKLLEGIGFWKQAYNRVSSKQFELEREQRKKDAAVQQPQHTQGVVRRGR